MRLVDADTIKDKWFWTEDAESGKAIDLDDLEKAKTIDAIEIVRCKDCTSRNDNDICERYNEDRPDPNGYCFKGEKKTDDVIEALDQYFERGDGAFASKQVIFAWQSIKKHILDHPIIYCKDCKFSKKDRRNYMDDLGHLYCENWQGGTDEYGYCFEGEKK